MLALIYVLAICSVAAILYVSVDWFETNRRLALALKLLILAAGAAADEPLLLFSVLYAGWVLNNAAFNGDAMRNLAEEFLSFAERRVTTSPRMIGYPHHGQFFAVNRGDCTRP